MNLPTTLDQVMLDPTLTLEQKGLYGLLMVITRDEQNISVSGLAKRIGCARKTLRHYLAPLVAAGLVAINRSEQDKRTHLITLNHAVEDRSRVMIKAITRRLGQARRRIRDEGSRESVGEALMKEWLTLLIRELVFTDNARPGFLVSPMTKERLEYDRWYPSHRLAWEFHGPQHFRTGKNQPDPEQLARQQSNDLAKLGISQRQNIRLVEVEAKDLRLERMVALIPSGVPLRDLDGLGQVVNFLEEESLRYRMSAGLQD